LSYSLQKDSYPETWSAYENVMSEVAEPFSHKNGILPRPPFANVSKFDRMTGHHRS
jgi:hypothetical protein